MKCQERAGACPCEAAPPGQREPASPHRPGGSHPTPAGVRLGVCVQPQVTHGWFASLNQPPDPKVWLGLSNLAKHPPVALPGGSESMANSRGAKRRGVHGGDVKRGVPAPSWLVPHRGTRPSEAN